MIIDVALNMGSSIKEKNLLLKEQILSFKSWPYWKGIKIGRVQKVELLPPFTLILIIEGILQWSIYFIMPHLCKMHPAVHLIGLIWYMSLKES